MRISSSKQFILFHLPRTGVSSIIAALDDRLFERAEPSTRNKLVSKYLPFIQRPVDRTFFRVHEKATRVRRLLPAASFDSYRKIAFVRNPYSWLVSLYELVLQSPNHRHHRTISAMSGFSDYIDWEIRRNKRMQYPYLYDRRGQLLANHIGRYERLAEDAARIFESMGVELQPLPRVGQFTRRDYREFYDSATQQKVASHWERDLDLFGYGFDGPLPGAVPDLTG